MNGTDAIKAHKLSAGMVDALTGAAFNESATGHGEGGYVIMADIHPRTRKALHDRGLMYGHYYLTRTGVEVLATLDGNTVDVRGYEWDGNKLRVAAYVETYAEDMATVEIQGEWEEPRTMVDVDGSVIPYDAFRSQEIQEAHRRIADGGCVGLCAVGTGCAHCDEQYGPEASQTDAESVSEFVPMDRTGDGITSVMTVAVIQNSPGMSGLTHYHTPGCRDIQKEMRKFGQRPSDAFENGFDSVAEILEFEFGDIASDNEESGTAQWWAEIFYNANPGPHGGVKIMPCLANLIPNGETNDGSPVVYAGDLYRAGFKRSQESQDAARAAIAEHNVNTCDERECVTCWAKLTSDCKENHTGNSVCSACESVTIEYDESSRKFPCLMVGGVIMHKGECAQAHGVNGPVCSLEIDESEDAGFVETESTDDYATVARLSTGAGFHTVKDETTSTGTTHHTMDTHGGQWTRFEHVLSVGDIVRSTETGRTLYEVYALIPGLPVIYVDPCDGREPFPMGATSLYAL